MRKATSIDHHLLTRLGRKWHEACEPNPRILHRERHSGSCTCRYFASSVLKLWICTLQHSKHTCQTTAHSSRCVLTELTVPGLDSVTNKKPQPAALLACFCDGGSRREPSQQQPTPAKIPSKCSSESTSQATAPACR